MNSSELMIRLSKFLADLRDPDVWGHAVSNEVRTEARILSRELLLQSPPSPLPPLKESEK